MDAVGIAVQSALIKLQKIVDAEVYNPREFHFEALSTGDTFIQDNLFTLLDQNSAASYGQDVMNQEAAAAMVLNALSDLENYGWGETELVEGLTAL